MLKIKKCVHIVHVGEGSEEESKIVLEMARRCKPFRMHFRDIFT